MSYRDLSGLEDLDALLDSPDELGGFFSAIGKVFKTVAKVVKPALKVATLIPGVGTIAGAVNMGIDAAETAGSMLSKGGGGGQAAPSQAAQAVRRDSTRRARRDVGSTKRKRKTKPKVKTRIVTRTKTKIVRERIPLDVNTVIAAATAALGPQMAQAAKTAQQLDIQAKATAEHKKRLANDALRRALLKRV